MTLAESLRKAAYFIRVTKICVESNDEAVHFGARKKNRDRFNADSHNILIKIKGHLMLKRL